MEWRERERDPFDPRVREREETRSSVHGGVTTGTGASQTERRRNQTGRKRRISHGEEEEVFTPIQEFGEHWESWHKKRPKKL